jgi:hypothetical protein
VPSPRGLDGSRFSNHPNSLGLAGENPGAMGSCEVGRVKCSRWIVKGNDLRVNVELGNLVENEELDKPGKTFFKGWMGYLAEIPDIRILIVVPAGTNNTNVGAWIAVMSSAVPRRCVILKRYPNSPVWYRPALWRQVRRTPVCRTTDLPT